MHKLFTLEAARRMLPDVDARLRTLRTAIHDLEEAQERHQGLPVATSEGMAARQELAFLVSAVHDARRHLADLGVMVPDVQRGVVEFPARLGGEMVHLLWEPGQPSITHYHRLMGSTDPRPVPTPAVSKPPS